MERKCNDSMESERRELSLYVHIPFCKAKCVYCDFLSFGGYGYLEQKQYIEALCKEIEAYRPFVGEYRITTIFFGGGTPSYLYAGMIAQIMQTIREVFYVEADAEITIEGNPDSLTKDKLFAYRKMGINRLSIGLQSANDEVLKRLGRVHNCDQFIAAYSNARQAGFINVNVDLMSGLPGEDEDSYIRTLAKVVKLQPEHISAYSLIVEEGTPLSENDKLLERLPSDEEDRRIYNKTKILLKNSGYERYEISNYSVKGYECRHNIAYWKLKEYLGVGLGASSRLDVYTLDSDMQTMRFQGITDFNEYIDFFVAWKNDRVDSLKQLIQSACWEQQISETNDQMEEFMFLGLRMMKGISKKEFYKRFHVDIEDVYGKIIEKYIKKQLLIEIGDRLYLSDAGIDVSNVIMAEFLL